MQAALQETPLWLDVERIFNNPKPVPIYSFTAKLHTESEDIVINNLLSIDRVRDYAKKIGDEIRVKFQLPFGDYLRKFYPNRNNLEFTLVRSTIGPNGEPVLNKESLQQERFKAIFVAGQNPNANLTQADKVDTFTLNNRPPVDITLQLLNRSLEPMRVKTFHGVFSGVANGDLVRGILGSECSKILIDGRPSIDALDIVQPDNKDLVRQVIFPNNMSLMSLPTFLQERHTGLYSGGVGSYFQVYNQKRTWFIYPLYNTKRFDEPVPKLIIYAISGQQYGGVDKTYMVEGKTLHIVASGQQQYVDDGESNMMQKGVGFRQVKADAIMDKPVKLLAKGPMGIRKLINTETIMRDRKDMLNFAPVAAKEIANNVFAEYSRSLEKNGARMDVIWHNSDPSLLYPGMPVRYVYLSEETVKEVKGILLFNQSTITKGTPSRGAKQTDNVFTSQTAMTLFVERFTDAK